MREADIRRPGRLLDEADRLLSQMSTAVVAVDGERHVRRWNESAERTFRLPREAALGRDFLRLPLLWGDPTTAERLWEARKAGSSVRFDDLGLLQPGGGTALLGATVTGFEPHGMLVVARDITEVRQQQADQMRAMRHEAISRLSSGIAHEFNTPLQVLDSSLAICSRETAELISLLPAGTIDADVEDLRQAIGKAIQLAVEASQQIASLVEGMRVYSGSRAVQRVPVDINDCLRRVIALSEPQWNRVARLDLDLDSGTPSISGDPRGIFEALFHLVDNAWRAISDHTALERGQGRLTVRSAGPSASAVIEICDNGVGMSDATRQRAFDPFFTTRVVGEGSGQGLAIARSIVQAHGGTIELQSELSRGTLCRVSLPRRMS